MVHAKIAKLGRTGQECFYVGNLGITEFVRGLLDITCSFISLPLFIRSRITARIPPLPFS